MVDTNHKTFSSIFAKIACILSSVDDWLAFHLVCYYGTDISTDSGEMKRRRVRVHFVSSVPKYRNSKLMFIIILFCEQNHNLEIECGNDILETFSGNFNDINIARNSDDSMRILFQCPRMRYDTARSEEKERVYSIENVYVHV